MSVAFWSEIVFGVEAADALWSAAGAEVVAAGSLLGVVELAEFCEAVEEASLLAGVEEEAEALGAAAAVPLLISEELLLAPLFEAELVAAFDDPAAEVLAAAESLCGVAFMLELSVELLEDGIVEAAAGGAVLAPEPVEQEEETMLALETLKVPSLFAMPVTDNVCPTWSLNAVLLLDCNCHALPLLSVRV